MASYSMAEIVALTGINAHTLRKWESRYDFLIPNRTDTNIRFYSDVQLRKLLNIDILIRNGNRISKINKMTDDEITEQVSNILIDSNQSDEINALISSMIQLDELAFDNTIDRIIKNKGLLATVIEVIYPFLNQIGILWTTHKAMPAQEHFISNLIRQKIFAAIEKLPLANKEAPKIVLFLIEDEDHEIGLLLANYIARELGWRVFYLGTKVPLENIEKVVEITKPQLLLSLFILSRPQWVTSKINVLVSKTKVPIAISGNPINFTDFAESKQVNILKNPQEMISYLSKKSKTFKVKTKK
ncbi:MerR family transcriptional regulator [Aurantibacter crassamenti]|uniref:MerR family transcriptional regulator n=1 Tax=Aurantibacter crassamenti TaxID=1837375 RepID=UPI001939C82C|nr:MerR family transcriptional regulator [Aurantibacter crassamenti]MBM1104818.1 MerR family transcriptional regulator [Aurantibacter crassamenti]